MQNSLNETRSIYLQIAEMIEDSILQDALLAEEQAPSTNELARVLGINPATAAKGLNRLADEGILYKKRGLGMFVAPGAKQTLLARRRQNFLEEKINALTAEAKRLQITDEELIAMITAAMQRPEEEY